VVSMSQDIEFDQFEQDMRDVGMVVEGTYAVITLEDSGGNQRTVTYPMKTSTGIGDIVNALDGITSAAIIGAVRETRLHAVGFDPPPGSSQVEAKAKLRLYDEEFTARTHTLYVPSPKQDIFIAATGDGANIVDVSNADVLAFVDLFDTEGFCYISAAPNRTAGGIRSGIRVTHKSKRG